MALDLVTVDDLRIAENVASGDMDSLRTERYQQAVDQASAAVITYIDRDIAATQTTEQRTFEYDGGSGFVDIDDCTNITDVTYSIGGQDFSLPSYQWRAEPFSGPVFTYLMLPKWGPYFSPEMGFTNNLDVLYREKGFVGLGPNVKVTAAFGWTTVPDDVKRAVLWTAAAMLQSPASYVSESIAGYSHTNEARTLTEDAIPGRAKDLLQPYLRLKVG